MSINRTKYWKDILINAIGDRIRLLSQNAEQVLGVVKATFGEALFDVNKLSSHCQNIEDLSDEQQLACQWFLAKRVSEHSLDHKEASDALVKVFAVLIHLSFEFR